MKVFVNSKNYLSQHFIIFISVVQNKNNLVIGKLPSVILWPSVREELKSVKGYENSKLSSWMITKEPGMFLNDLESHLPLLWDKNILDLTYD